MDRLQTKTNSLLNHKVELPRSIGSLFVITLLLLTAMHNANAVTINVVGTDDTVVQSLLNTSPENAAYVGVGGPLTDAGLAGILFFQLPDLSSSPLVQSADLSVTLSWARNSGIAGQVPTTFNVDLYSLGTRSIDQIIEPGDYGDGGSVPPTAKLIANDWWVAGDNSQIGLTKTIDIASAVSAEYVAGVPIDNYLVLALYADIPLSNNDYTSYGFLRDEYAAPGELTEPVLLITAVPVPAAVWLFGSGLLGLIGIARRKKS